MALQDLTLVISVAALLVSGLAFWRTELRGPMVRCQSVPGSTVVAMDARADGKLLVNIWRDVLFTNDSRRPAYVSMLHCQTTELAPLGATRLDIGVAGGAEGKASIQVPQADYRLDVSVAHDQPQRVVLTWWLVLGPGQEDAVKATIRDPGGVLWMDVTWTSLEATLVWPRFKTRHVRIRPKDHPDEMVYWRKSPYGA